MAIAYTQEDYEWMQRQKQIQLAHYHRQQMRYFNGTVKKRKTTHERRRHVVSEVCDCTGCINGTRCLH